MSTRISYIKPYQMMVFFLSPFKSICMCSVCLLFLVDVYLLVKYADIDVLRNSPMLIVECFLDVPNKYNFPN